MSPSKDSQSHISASPSEPKLAIKGFSLSSRSLTKPKNSLKPPQPSSTLGKRPRTALHDDSASDDEASHGAHEVVTAFDARAGGAVTAATEKDVKEQLIIPKMKNRDWREEMRKKRGKNLLPAEVQAQRRGEGVNVDAPLVPGETELVWGLSIKKKVERRLDEAEPQTMVETTSTVVEAAGQSLHPSPEKKTDDQLALEALLGVKAERKGPDLVIPVQEDDSYDAPLNEEDAYRRAIKAAPDVSTLEDYERVPVEEFGAALLRGMGWKEGSKRKGQVDRPKEVKRRQNLLGLGATQLKDAEELGAWVQKSDPKKMTGGSSSGRPDRRPKPSEYKRDKERRDEGRGSSYRSERDRERERERGAYRDRDGDRRRDRDYDRRR